MVPSGMRNAPLPIETPDLLASLIARAAAFWDVNSNLNTLSDSDTLFEILKDLSGNGNDLTQATSADRPAVQTEGGRLWADFDGTDTRLLNTSPTAELMNNFDTGGTVLFVIRPDAIGEGNFGRLYQKGLVTEQLWTAFQSGGSCALGWGFTHVTTSVEGDQTNSPITLGGRHVIGFRYNKSLISTSSLRLRINSTVFTDSGSPSLQIYGGPAGAASDNSALDFYLGDNANTNRNFNGGIAIGGFWPEDLPDPEFNFLFDHFGDLYSVTV